MQNRTLSHVCEVTDGVGAVVESRTGVGQTGVGADAQLDHVTLKTRLVAALQKHGNTNQLGLEMFTIACINKSKSYNLLH